jgi:hypothetical protein
MRVSTASLALFLIAAPAATARTVMLGDSMFAGGSKVNDWLQVRLGCTHVLCCGVLCCLPACPTLVGIAAAVVAVFVRFPLVVAGDTIT